MGWATKHILGEFQSGQMGQTVNLLATPSVVRIHPLPLLQKFNSPKLVDCSFVVLGGGVKVLQKDGRCFRVATFGVPKRTASDCGSSSVDRASAFQAEGREFEPRLPLKRNKTIYTNTYLITTTKLWQKKNLTGQNLT